MIEKKTIGISNGMRSTRKTTSVTKKSDIKRNVIDLIKTVTTIKMVGKIGTKKAVNTTRITAGITRKINTINIEKKKIDIRRSIATKRKNGIEKRNGNVLKIGEDEFCSVNK